MNVNSSVFFYVFFLLFIHTKSSFYVIPCSRWKSDTLFIQLFFEFHWLLCYLWVINYEKGGGHMNSPWTFDIEIWGEMFDLIFLIQGYGGLYCWSLVQTLQSCVFFSFFNYKVSIQSVFWNDLSFIELMWLLFFL